eukprot:645928_1
MSSVSMLWLSICVALTQSQSYSGTICVWNGISNANDPTYANPNGEYTLAGTTTDPEGGSHNYWEKSQSDCPQFIQALWWKDQKNYWCIWNTLSPDWEATSHPLLECDDSPIDNPLLCPSSWLDWTSTPNSILSSITLQSGSCPSLTCPAIQVTNSGLSACNKLFLRDLTKKNVFTYNSGSTTTTRYLYFNSNTFKWHCSDTLNLQSCDETASASVSSKTDGWTDVSVGSQFTLTLSNDKNAIFRCTTAPSPAPTAKPTLSPSRSPTPNPTRKPTIHPTKQPSANPLSPPTKQPTKTPSKELTKTPTTQPTTKPTKQPTPALISKTTREHVQDTSAMEASQATEELSHVLDEDDEIFFSEYGDGLLILAAAILIVVLVLGCICVYCPICIGNGDRKQKENVVLIKANSARVSNAKPMDNSSDSDQSHDSKYTVHGWLEHEVELVEYASNFINHGYTSLDTIMNIQGRDVLKEIGVNKIGHQTLILREIEKLIAMSSLAPPNPDVETRSSPPPPPPPVSSVFSIEQEVGELIKNDEVSDHQGNSSDEDCVKGITVGGKSVFFDIESICEN